MLPEAIDPCVCSWQLLPSGGRADLFRLLRRNYGPRACLPKNTHNLLLELRRRVPEGGDRPFRTRRHWVTLVERLSAELRDNAQVSDISPGTACIWAADDGNFVPGTHAGPLHRQPQFPLRILFVCIVIPDVSDD